jgi:thiol-disulfide isomerase/thioredoxin
MKRLTFAHRWPLFLLPLFISWGTVEAESTQPQTPPVLLQMIRDETVHHDLGLSDPQRDQLLRVLQEVDGPWFRSRNLPAEQQHREVAALTGRVQDELVKILTPDQQQRVNQLVRQALGTRMVLNDDVIAELGLSPSTVESLRAAFLDTDQKVASVQSKLQSGSLTAEAANQETNRIKSAERQSLVKLLNDTQKAKIGALTGESFDFARVQRTYPLAPELSADGVTWIQGGPLKLEELRGKVVAVHFYAFQCINCQRNLPHYQAWHNDYADKGLVIIGIQTPETSAERQLDQVSAAVKSDAMEYPVLLDAQSGNWNAWSNTMWPTVYLIDKQGFIRRWWQGELNWQGTLGEQQLRGTIEQLLAE